MASESPVEVVKRESRLLRGSIAESLADPVTGALREPDTHLLKFHGSYQQDDRDLREERERQKLEPAYSFMVRTRLPGGVCTPRQWLVLAGLARRYGSGSLRLTTRQTVQLHGIIKRDLKPAIAAMNAALVDSIASCGDVNRNVMASPNPVESALHLEVHEWARRLSEHLLPRTRAYHEIWLDGKKVEGPPETEPLYGPTYLPRKFKAGIAVPPHNDIDVYSQDMGFIAIAEGDRLAGFNLVVGGGLGMSHGEPGTFPRLADLIGFLAPTRLLAVGEAVVAIQRDHGDRGNRKHARLKYTIADRGVDWFRTELARRLGGELAPPRPFTFTTQGDRFGWLRGINGRRHLTLRIESGRIAADHLAGLERIAEIHDGDFRFTPNQNLIIANVPADAVAKIDRLVAEHGLGEAVRGTPLRRDALACVALPTCPLAMAEAERYLPIIVRRIEGLLDKWELGNIPLTLRITGCPNGCARPYLAEIGLVGRAPGRYVLRLGADAAGQRLNVVYRDNIDEAEILTVLDELFGRYRDDRETGERFGDFLWRVGILAPESAA